MKELKETQVMGELKMVKLAKITPSATNPRKTFDEDAITELAESIREKGVIQPVLLRPLGVDTYELVCGERRYRASLRVNTDFKDRNDIPAYIRDMNDDEALELQITENLQRKDVHPMEEAAAFAAMLPKYPTTEEVAARVGKKEYFVKQRLKLNELTDNWQKAFYNNKVLLSDAMRVCTLPQESQDSLWNNKVGKVTDIHELPEIEFNHWDFSSRICDLKSATFDLADDKLDKKAGACTACPFNSAVSNLFPEMADEMECTNKACFTRKSDTSFDIALKTAKEDPTVVLVSDKYYDYGDGIIGKLKKEKHSVLMSDKYSTQNPPKPLDKEDYTDDAQYNDALAKYEKKLEDFNKAVERGKFTKAFLVDGSGRGRFIHITISKTASKDNKNKKDAGPTPESVQEEIDGIVKRQNRALELDAEKVHAKVKPALKETSFWNSKEPLSDNEYIGAIIFLYNRIGWSERDVVTSILGKKFDIYDDKLYKHIIGYTSENLMAVHAQLLRYVIFKELCGHQDNPDKSDNAAAIRFIATQYIPEDVKTFDLEQQEIAIKRKERTDKRLAALKAQKKELEAAAKPKAEKPAAKGKGVKALLNDAPVSKDKGGKAALNNVLDKAFPAEKTSKTNNKKAK